MPLGCGAHNKKIMKKRNLIQLITAILYNCNFTGFIKSEIYTGDIKKICVPGLNCYSCPGAIASCPLGSFQSALLNTKYNGIPFYVLGFLILFGIILARIICGFLCPFGLLQDLLYKIKTKKIKKNKITKKLSYLKYIILIIFILIIPIIFLTPGFCKYICPQGTFSGGLPLIFGNDYLKYMIGKIFTLKIIILIICLSLVIFIYRAFCRFICPLGAIYSFFNKISIFGMIVDENKCTHCNKCIKICKMDIEKVGDRECIACTECINICPEKVIKFGKRY